MVVDWVEGTGMGLLGLALGKVGWGMFCIVAAVGHIGCTGKLIRVGVALAWEFAWDVFGCALKGGGFGLVWVCRGIASLFRMDWGRGLGLALISASVLGCASGLVWNVELVV